MPARSGSVPWRAHTVSTRPASAKAHQLATNADEGGSVSGTWPYSSLRARRSTSRPIPGRSLHSFTHAAADTQLTLLCVLSLSPSLHASLDALAVSHARAGMSSTGDRPPWHYKAHTALSNNHPCSLPHSMPAAFARRFASPHLPPRLPPPRLPPLPLLLLLLRASPAPSHHRLVFALDLSSRLRSSPAVARLPISPGDQLSPSCRRRFASGTLG